jgi:hypothetical protein
MKQPRDFNNLEKENDVKKMTVFWVIAPYNITDDCHRPDD